MNKTVFWFSMASAVVFLVAMAINLAGFPRAGVLLDVPAVGLLVVAEILRRRAL